MWDSTSHAGLHQHKIVIISQINGIGVRQACRPSKTQLVASNLHTKAEQHGLQELIMSRELKEAASRRVSAISW